MSSSQRSRKKKGAETVAPGLLLQSLLELGDDDLAQAVPYITRIVKNHPMLYPEVHGESKGYNAWVERLIQCLSSGRSRIMWAGCSLVSCVFDSAPHAIVKAYASQILKAVLAVYNDTDQAPSVRLVAIGAARDVASRCCTWPDSRRDFVVSSLPKVAAMVIDGIAHEWARELSMEVVERLAVVLKGSMRPWEKQIVGCLTTLLSRDNSHLSETAARTLTTFLSSCGEQSYKDFFSTLVAHMEGLIQDPMGTDALERGGLAAIQAKEKKMEMEEDREEEQNTDESFFAPLPEDASFKRTLALQRQFQSCSMLLVHMLRSPVEVPTRRLLRLVDDVLSIEVTGASLRSFKGGDISHLELWSIIASLQVGALDVLHTLVLVAGRNLIVHSRSLMSTLTRALRRTAYSSKLQLFPSPSVRVALIKVYTLSVEIVGPGSIKDYCGPMMELMLHDVVLPLRKQMEMEKEREASKFSMADAELQKPSSDDGGRRGKKRKQGQKAAKYLDLSSTLSDFDDSQGAAMLDMCLHSLRAIEFTLSTCGAHLSVKSRSAIDTMLLSLLLFAQSESGEKFASSCGGWKQALLECAVASILAPTTVQSPLLPYAGRFFRAFLFDVSFDVRRVCRRGLAVCETISHPRSPLPVSTNDNAVGTFSLSSLLGEDATSDEEKVESSKPTLLNAMVQTDAVEFTTDAPTGDNMPPPISRCSTDAAINLAASNSSAAESNTPPPIFRSQTDYVDATTKGGKRKMSGEEESESTESDPRKVSKVDHLLNTADADSEDGSGEFISFTPSASDIRHPVEPKTVSKGLSDMINSVANNDAMDVDGEVPLIVDAEPDEAEDTGSLWSF